MRYLIHDYYQIGAPQALPVNREGGAQRERGAQRGTDEAKTGEGGQRTGEEIDRVFASSARLFQRTLIGRVDKNW